MGFIRPEVGNLIRRHRELIWALGVAAVGLWLIWLGGLIFVPLGAAVLAMATGLGLMAWRRQRFAQTIGAPGVVEVDEAQIGFLGPGFGGYVSLSELEELRLVTLHGRRLWRLKQSDGQTIVIPVDAAGADRLFDAFASLPGLGSAALLAALEAPAVQGQGGLPSLRDAAAPPPVAAFRVVWHRQHAIAQR